MRTYVAVLVLWFLPITVNADQSAHPITVYRTPTCGCCKHWVAHLEENGFQVDTVDRQSLEGIKRQHGITPRLSSCHTGVVSGAHYAFEGHVPAYLVARFLDDPPDGARGLTVPGMPVGSPGMEMGNRFQPYEVLMIQKDGTATVYESVSDRAQQYVSLEK